MPSYHSCYVRIEWNNGSQGIKLYMRDNWAAMGLIMRFNELTDKLY
jgi:hypothetical protein